MNNKHIYVYNLIWCRNNNTIVENFIDYNTALNAFIELFNSTNNNPIVKNCVNRYINEDNKYHYANFSLFHSNDFVSIKLEKNRIV